MLGSSSRRIAGTSRAAVPIPEIPDDLLCLESRKHRGCRGIVSCNGSKGIWMYMTTRTNIYQQCMNIYSKYHRPISCGNTVCSLSEDGGFTDRCHRQYGRSHQSQLRCEAFGQASYYPVSLKLPFAGSRTILTLASCGQRGPTDRS